MCSFKFYIKNRQLSLSITSILETVFNQWNFADSDTSSNYPTPSPSKPRKSNVNPNPSVITSLEARMNNAAKVIFLNLNILLVGPAFLHIIIYCLINTIKFMVLFWPKSKVYSPRASLDFYNGDRQNIIIHLI